MHTLKEPLRTEFLSYLPAPDAGRGIGFYSLYQDVMENHPITVINRYDGIWDLSFRYNFERVKEVNWEDDTDGVPEALKKEPVVFIVQGGIGHFSLPFEELLGWFTLEPGYDTADFNRELRELCFEHVFSNADEYHFGTRDQADTILWEVARCLLAAFSPPMILHHDHLVSLNLNDHAPSTFSKRARDSCIRLPVTPSLGAG